MTYDQIVELISFITNSIKDGTIAIGREIRSLPRKVFSVKIVNPQKEIQVTGKVDVDQTKTQDKIKDIALSIRELKKALRPKDEVKVSNFPKLQKFPEFPKFPSKIEITNPQKVVKVEDFSKLLETNSNVAKYLKDLKLDPKIEVKAPIVNVSPPEVNVPKQPAPIVNVEAPDLSEIKRIMDFLEAISAKKPLAVQLAHDGKFYKALEKMAEVYAGSSFSSFQSLDGGDGRATINEKNELVVTESNYKKRIVKSGTITYIARASRGTEYTDAGWLVQKIDETDPNDVNITWASTGFDQPINDIENLTYE